MHYHVLSDGTVLCDFNHEKTMNVSFDRWLGAMYQEKLDVFGGAIHRRIPKTLPLTLSDGTFDFNTPISLEKGEYKIILSDLGVKKLYCYNPQKDEIFLNNCFHY